MSTPNPFAVYQQLVQALSQQAGAGTNAYWQGCTAYFQTFGSIMQQRGNAFTQWCQQQPQWQSRFAQCQNFAEFCQLYAEWCGHTLSQTASLTADVTAQRAYLWQQWKQLAQRGLSPAPAAMDASATSLPPQPQKQTVPATVKARATIINSASAPKQTASQQSTAQTANATTSQAPSPQAQRPQAQASLQLAQPAAHIKPADTAEAPLRSSTATPLRVATSSTATSVARSSTQAAAISSSGAPRRSVLASRRARSKFARAR